MRERGRERGKERRREREGEREKCRYIDKDIDIDRQIRANPRHAALRAPGVHRHRRQRRAFRDRGSAVGVGVLKVAGSRGSD